MGNLNTGKVHKGLTNLDLCDKHNDCDELYEVLSECY